MKKWDLYTKYREKTGEEHIRGEEIPEGLYHLVVHVWIRNSRGEYLLSRRAADRLDCGNHQRSGRVQMAAQRPDL